MKLHPRVIAFIQAIGVTLYAWFVAYIMNSVANGSNFGQNHAIIMAALFLLFFILSALLSASMVFGYPIWLFIKGQGQRSVQIVLWTAAWLTIIFLAFLLSVVLNVR